VVAESRPADAEPQLTLQAAAQIRGLIIDRVLLPGEKIRQVELAERIGVSRSPLREALRTLESEGVVTYEINRGYVVARLDDEDLAQIHRMRSLLEDELLRTVKRPDAAVLNDLKDLNEKMMVAIDERNVAEVLRYNRDFHFTIFDWRTVVLEQLAQGGTAAALAHRWQRTVPDVADGLPQLSDTLGSRSCGWKSDVHVGHLLGHAPEGFGKRREIRGADAALVVQVPQPPLGPVDEVGPRAEPEPAETVVPAHGGGLAHHPEQMAIA
jgi:DNA-binding GntR family transcriptional regulator